MSAEERERVEAAVAFLNGKAKKDEDLELVAFMAIFHPDRERPKTRRDAEKWREE